MTAWPSLSPGSDREHPTRGPSDSDSRACRIIIMMSESLCHRIRLGGTDLDSPGPSYHYFLNTSKQNCITTNHYKTITHPLLHIITSLLFYNFLITTILQLDYYRSVFYYYI